MTALVAAAFAALLAGPAHAVPQATAVRPDAPESVERCYRHELEQGGRPGARTVLVCVRTER